MVGKSYGTAKVSLVAFPESGKYSNFYKKMTVIPRKIIVLLKGRFLTVFFFIT